MTATARGRAVPDDIAAGLVWAWPRGRLQLRFPDAEDEEREIVRLIDWLAEDTDNSAALATFMLAIEDQSGDDCAVQYGKPLLAMMPRRRGAATRAA